METSKVAPSNEVAKDARITSRNQGIIEKLFQEPLPPVLNIPSRISSELRTKDEKDLAQEIVYNFVEKIMETTHVRGTEDLAKRNELYTKMESDTTLVAQDLYEIHKRVTTKIEKEYKTSILRKHDANTVLAVAMISLSDLISDLVCIGLYLSTGNAELRTYAYISIGLVTLTQITNVIITLLNKGHWHEYILSMIGLGPLVDAYYIVSGTYGDNDGKNRNINLQSLILGRRIVEYSFESMPQSIIMMLSLGVSLKSNLGPNRNAIITAQIISLCISTLAVAVGLSTGSVSLDLSDSRVTHPWTFGFCPLNALGKNLCIVFLTFWIWMHLLLSVIGISSMISFANGFVTLGVFFGMFILFTIVTSITGSALIYKHFGVLNALHKVSSIVFFYGFVSPLWKFLLFILSFIGPIPILRTEPFFGGRGFAFSVMSTLLFDFTTILIFPTSPVIKLVGIICGVVWLCSCIAFFMMITPKYRITFFYTLNWKNCVRTQIWNHPEHSSQDWGHPSLIGNLDASRAHLCIDFWEWDLSFNDVCQWINDNKNQWENHPPLWYNSDWKSKLPHAVFDKCFA